MKIKVLVFFISLFPFTSWGKIIPTSEVRSNFEKLLSNSIPKILDISSKTVNYAYTPIFSTLEISNPENPLLYLAELEAGTDYYEIHININSLVGSINYHLNAIIMVDYFKTNLGYYQYRMLPIGIKFSNQLDQLNFYSERVSKPFNIEKYEWTRTNPYY